MLLLTTALCTIRPFHAQCVPDAQHVNTSRYLKMKQNCITDLGVWWPVDYFANSNAILEISI